MSIFGWSLPPGCGTLPGEEDEQPIQLHEDSTLKGYGRRRHGLNGKDADLDYGGQLVVKDAWWFSDGTIRVSARGCASIVPREYPEEGETEAHFDSYMNAAYSIVCDASYAGEWDGDYWVFSNEPIELSIDLQWADDLSEAQNIDAALQLVYDKLQEANKPFEDAMAQLARDINSLSPDEPRRPRNRHGRQSRKAAFASYAKRMRAWHAEMRS